MCASPRQTGGFSRPLLAGVRHLTILLLPTDRKTTGPTSLPLPFALSNLEIQLSRQHNPHPGLLHSIFTTSLHSLQSLTLLSTDSYKTPFPSHEATFASLPPVFPLVASILLHLPFTAFPPPTSLSPPLGTCTSLESLTLTFADANDFTPNVRLELLVQTIDEIPPSISRLAFAFTEDRMDALQLSAAIPVASRVISSPLTVNLQCIDFIRCTGDTFRRIEGRKSSLRSVGGVGSGSHVR